jgi:hypothetical protein
MLKLAKMLDLDPQNCESRKESSLINANGFLLDFFCIFLWRLLEFLGNQRIVEQDYSKLSDSSSQMIPPAQIG